MDRCLALRRFALLGTSFFQRGLAWRPRPNLLVPPLSTQALAHNIYLVNNPRVRRSGQGGREGQERAVEGCGRRRACWPPPSSHHLPLSGPYKLLAAILFLLASPSPSLLALLLTLQPSLSSPAHPYLHRHGSQPLAPPCPLWQGGHLAAYTPTTAPAPAPCTPGRGSESSGKEGDKRGDVRSETRTIATYTPLDDDDEARPQSVPNMALEDSRGPSLQPQTKDGNGRWSSAARPAATSQRGAHSRRPFGAARARFAERCFHA